MDASMYKDFTTSRGVKYRYFFSKPAEGKPYLALFHGYPSTSRDWSKQVPFFREQGYGLIVPDMLGYGGTDKPKEVEDYRPSLMTKDMVELLDAEKAEEVIAIGHDWGSMLTSRLAARYQNRFIAFAFLAAGYTPPAPTFDYQQVLQMNRQLFGNDIYGYWTFMDSDGAWEFSMQHFDSCYSLTFAEDSSLWLTHIGPLGATREFLLKDTKVPVAKYVDPEDKELRRAEFMDSQLAGMNWYRLFTRGVSAKDDADIPTEQYTVNKPVFFGAALRDYICKPDRGKSLTGQFCPKMTSVDFDTDHWVMLAEPDQLNQEIHKWVSTLTSKVGKM